MSAVGGYKIERPDPFDRSFDSESLRPSVLRDFSLDELDELRVVLSFIEWTSKVEGLLLRHKLRPFRL